MGSRVLRIAGRVILCVALALLPAATATASLSASQHGIALKMAQVHGTQAEAPGTPGDDCHHPPLCHHLGTCPAVVAAPLEIRPLERAPLIVGSATIVAPPKAAAHRLFRPPRAAAGA